jgi:long-chain acyl-CoA synthetase
MTEGGGTCILEAHLHPTSCTPSASRRRGHDIRLIDEQGVEIALPPPGEQPARSSAARAA